MEVREFKIKLLSEFEEKLDTVWAANQPKSKFDITIWLITQQKEHTQMHDEDNRLLANRAKLALRA